MLLIEKPAAGEYRDFAAVYVNKVPDDGNVLQHLRDGVVAVQTWVTALPEDKLTTPYAPGKWTIKEALVHMMDTERIMAYRALRIARADQTNLPGFEQDDFVPYSLANERSLESIMEEYQLQRQSTVALFNNFPANAFARIGFANGAPFSVRAAVYIIAGHELHHLQILKEKYV